MLYLPHKHAQGVFPCSTTSPSSTTPLTSACFCETCNRVRLTSDGRLKLCLNHTAGLDLRALLRAGASDDEILRKIARAIELKPARHEFFKENRDAEVRRMNEIGG